MINATVYADAKMEPNAITLLVLALVSLDSQADTVKPVFEIFPDLEIILNYLELKDKQYFVRLADYVTLFAKSKERV